MLEQRIPQSELVQVLQAHAKVPIALPTYDRSLIKPGIIHFGAGRFFLSHWGSINNDLMNIDSSHYNWGLCAVSIHTPDIIRRLAETQGEYILVEEQDGERKFSVQGAVIECLYGPESWDDIMRRMSDPNVKLITATLTPAGYHLTAHNPENPFLNLRNHDVATDLKWVPESKSHPRTVFPYLAYGLSKRHNAGLDPIVILSLDNVADNSRILREGLLKFMKAVGFPTTLRKWVGKYVEFRTTVVDRITPPAISPRLRRELEEQLGIYGVASPVFIVSEEYRQLFIEKGGRRDLPKLEAVNGVKFVEDARTWWQIKFYGLNAAHQVVGIIAQRLGFEYIYEAMANPLVEALLQFFHDEVSSFLTGSESAVKSYLRKVRQRFKDPSIKDKVERVCERSIEKISLRILAMLEKAQAAGKKELPVTPILIMACWLLNLNGYDENLQHIARGKDEHELENLRYLAGEVYGWLDNRGPQQERLEHLAVILHLITDVVRDQRFANWAKNEVFLGILADMLDSLSRHNGVETTIQEILQNAQKAQPDFSTN